MKPNLESVVCPVCDCPDNTLFLEVPDYSISKEVFSIVSCNKCDFKYTNPRPKAEEIGPYYESEDYISHSNTNKGIISKVYQMVRKHTINKKIELIDSVSREIRELLDYGCGTGEFLHEISGRNWKVTGIEPGEKARNYGKEHYKLNVLEPKALKSIPRGTFGVITMWHVLEHVHTLNETIEDLKDKLVENGVLIVAVPNSDSADAEIYRKTWAAYDVPRHLYHFNTKSIKNLFEKHQMQVEKVLPMVFDSFYVSMLSEKYLTGSTNYVKALLNGWKSNSQGKKAVGRYSSLIFVIRKR